MTANHDSSRRSPRRSAAVVALALIGAVATAESLSAQQWVERPFDPPVGSHWLIQSSRTSQDDAAGSHTSSTTATMAELSIDGKTADGFRITYTVRHSTFTGEPRIATIVGPISAALEGIVIRATVSPNGTPLHVDNLDDVSAKAKAAIDHLATSLADKPDLAAITRKLASAMLLPGAERAPRTYLATLYVLAMGQNTGLHPGAPKSDVENLANPFNGTPIKANATLAIAHADPATGNVSYVRTSTLDPDAIKQFLGSLVQQLAGRRGEQQSGDALLKQMNMQIDSRTELDVEQGMTRAVREESTVTAAMPGRSTVKHVHQELTVKPQT